MYPGVCDSAASETLPEMSGGVVSSSAAGSDLDRGTDKVSDMVKKTMVGADKYDI